MDQKEKDRIAAEIAAEYRSTIRQTAEDDRRNRTNSLRPKGFKSIGAAYLFWFIFGGLGVHRFYLGYTLTGTGMLMLSIASVLFSLMPAVYIFGFLMGGALTAWWVADAFLIPRMMPDPPDY